MKEIIKSTQIIHLAMCAGTLAACFIIGDIKALYQLNLEALSINDILFFLIPITAINLSNILYRSILKKIDPKLDLDKKAEQYRSACIVRYALLEGAIFLLLILQPAFLILCVLVILYLIYIRPSNSQFTKDVSQRMV